MTVECGNCGGPIYMETCGQNRGDTGHDFAVAGECQRCGLRHTHPCPECREETRDE